MVMQWLVCAECGGCLVVRSPGLANNKPERPERRATTTMGEDGQT